MKDCGMSSSGVEEEHGLQRSADLFSFEEDFQIAKDLNNWVFLNVKKVVIRIPFKRLNKYI